jgi:hypothetical protein
VTTAAATALRTLAFGDLESARWGLVWTPAEGDTVAILDGARVEGLEFALEPLSECTIAYEAKDGDEAPAPLTARICRISVSGGATTEALDCLGLEVLQGAPRLDELDSFRQVLAWFADDDALTVSAARPRKAGGHDRDEVLAAMIEPDGPLAIDEARLSTTYGEGGAAKRMSLELWTAGEEDDYPRRAAGEVSGPPMEASPDGVVLEVHPMRCHRAGRDGPGVYLIVRAGR